MKNQNEINSYLVIVKCDTGKNTIKTSATSAEKAKMLVMQAEGCPESAILSVRPEDQPILVTQIRYEKFGRSWVESSRKTQFYSLQQYRWFVEAKGFKSRAEYAYTPNGYNCVKDTNTRPDKQAQTVTLFDFDY
jgi:hypothetical protein